MSQLELILGTGPLPARNGRRRCKPAATREAAIAAEVLTPTRTSNVTLLPPERCVRWPGNPRAPSTLTPEFCHDLIESMKGADTQEVPIIARPLQNGFFEVVAGARRLYSAQHIQETMNPGFLLSAIVQHLSEREAWVACNAENVARKNLSAYERGLLLADGLRLHCEGSIPRLMTLAGLKRASVSRLLAVAKWPRELIDAFESPVQISIDAISALNPLLKDFQETLLAEAAAIVTERALGTEPALSGPAITDRLVTAANPKTKFQKDIHASNGTLVGHVRKYTKKGVLIEILVSPNQKLSKLMSRIGDFALGQLGAPATAVEMAPTDPD